MSARLSDPAFALVRGLVDDGPQVDSPESEVITEACALGYAIVVSGHKHVVLRATFAGRALIGAWRERRMLVWSAV